MFTIAAMCLITFLFALWRGLQRSARGWSAADRAVDSAALESQLDSMLGALDASERSYLKVDRQWRRQLRQATCDSKITRNNKAENDSKSLGANDQSQNEPGLKPQSLDEVVPQNTGQPVPPKLKSGRSAKSQRAAADRISAPPDAEKQRDHQESPECILPPESSARPCELFIPAKRMTLSLLCKVAVASALTAILRPLKVVAKSLWGFFARPRPPAISSPTTPDSIAA